MKLDKLPQSEAPDQESVLSCLARDARGKLVLLLLALSSAAGCATANTNSKAAMMDDVVEEVCSQIGRFQLSGGKIPPQLRELDIMCMEKGALEEQIAQLRNNSQRKAQ